MSQQTLPIKPNQSHPKPTKLLHKLLPQNPIQPMIQQHNLKLSRPPGTRIPPNQYIARMRITVHEPMLEYHICEYFYQGSAYLFGIEA